METHPSFDPAENDILSQLVPEGAEPGTPAVNVPTEEAAPAATPEPTQPPVATPEPAAAPQGTPEPTPQPTQPPTNEGNVKAALRASRQQEKRLRAELDRRDAEIDALKKGQVPENTELTEDELATLKEDFPAQYKVYLQTQRLNEHLATQRNLEQHDPEWQPPSYNPEVQEVIDQVPTLLAWQHDKDSQAKFARAVEYDKALFVDPDWKDRPAVERFNEAARRAQAALQPAPQPTAAPSAAPAARTDPALALANAPLDGPKGVSDFRGGGPANAPALDFDRMPDADIIASLRPED